jgi:hypothetical protein
MPQDVVDSMRSSPRWAELVALTPTLAYDSAVLGHIETGGTVLEDVAARAARPGLVLVGGESPRIMLEVSLRLAELLPAGSHRVRAGRGHVVPPDVLVPVVVGFLCQ